MIRWAAGGSCSPTTCRIAPRRGTFGVIRSEQPTPPRPTLKILRALIEGTLGLSPLPLAVSAVVGALVAIALILAAAAAGLLPGI